MRFTSIYYSLLKTSVFTIKVSFSFECFTVDNYSNALTVSVLVLTHVRFILIIRKIAKLVYANHTHCYLSVNSFKLYTFDSAPMSILNN